MRIFFLPTSELGMKDKLLYAPVEYKGGLWSLPLMDGLSDALRALGHETHTTDAWNPADSRPDDILVVQNHPAETWLWRLFYYLKNFKKRGGFVLERRRFFRAHYLSFPRRVLIQTESPMIMPYAYKNVPGLLTSGLYHKVFTNSRGWGKEIEYFNPYEYRNQRITSPHFNAPKEGFLVMVNGNMRPHSLFREYYGERLKAIRHFSNAKDFDLFGYNWDKPPRHFLYRGYKKYVEKVWRGSSGDKLETLSRYKFAICFENAAHPGYVSEKIYDCLAAGTVPVYLGAPDIETIVPPDCFIDFRKFGNYAELEAHLRSLGESGIAEYRRNILRFLNDDSTMKGMPVLAKEVIGIS